MNETNNAKFRADIYTQKAIVNWKIFKRSCSWMKGQQPQHPVSNTRSSQWESYVPLVVPFHNTNVSVNVLTLLFTVLWRIVQVWLQKVQFDWHSCPTLAETLQYLYNFLLVLLYFDLWPGQKCHSRWCTRRKWRILMVVMRGNRVGGNWLMKWDKVKKIPMVHS